MRIYKSTALYATRSHMRRKTVLPATQLSETLTPPLESLKRAQEKDLTQTEDAKLRESKLDLSLITKLLGTIQNLGQGDLTEFPPMKLTGVKIKTSDSLTEQEGTHTVRLLHKNQIPLKRHAHQPKQDYLFLETVMPRPGEHPILESTI